MPSVDNGPQQPERGALDYPTLDLANSWTGVSFWSPDPIIVRIDGQEVGLSSYEAPRFDPAAYPEDDARSGQLKAVNNVLMHGVEGIDAQDYDVALQDLATVTAAANSLLKLDPAELAKHRVNLALLERDMQDGRRAHIVQRITEMSLFVRSAASSLWARAEVIVAPSRRPDEIDDGRVMSAMFRLTDVRLDDSTENAPKPLPIFKDTEGNEGMYPGDFSLFIQEGPPSR